MTCGAGSRVSVQEKHPAALTHAKIAITAKKDLPLKMKMFITSFDYPTLKKSTTIRSP
jgi:hypothetical protein